MSAATQTNAQTLTAAQGARAGALSVRWIISAREDLVWFIGSVASSYALFALYVGGVVPLVPMVAAWAILIDAPHVFGTFSRTYFDRAERLARARLSFYPARAHLSLRRLRRARPGSSGTRPRAIDEGYRLSRNDAARGDGNR